MPEVDIRQFQNSLSETFRRYLFTQNFFPDSEAELRAAFWAALGREKVFNQDPLLSIIPAYRQVSSVKDLIQNSRPPQLHSRLKTLPSHLLYEHQIRSIERVQNGRNLIVATGTGSGKTECFLLPALDDALKTPGPGVRAIVIYPLNALANDQLDRLRDLLKPIPEITFGRYTGDTPWDRSELSEEDRKEILGPNERYTRGEIRASPPHILLTNFAMLEYLLLRPGDIEIFSQQRLRYVILDEAHTYSGAQGIEVGLLMRRLQQAFPKCRLQFILTSATLGTDKEQIARFGRDLTGATFEPEDVILGAPIDPFAAGTSPRLPLEHYERAVPDAAALNKWLQAVDSAAVGDEDGSGDLKQLLKTSGLRFDPSIFNEKASKRLLARWLSGNAELATLHGAASDRPLALSEAAIAIWGRDTESALRLTHWLVVLGARAVLETDSAPLLPARYHLFFRGLKGGTVCLSRLCSEKRKHPGTAWSNLVIEDCRTCPAIDCGKYVVPLLSCVHCGTPVVRVYDDGNGKWQAQPASPLQSVHLLSWLNGGDEESEEEDAPADQPNRSATLCLSCQAIATGADLSACCNEPDRVRLTVLRTDKPDGLLKKCPTCGGERGGFQTVLREITTFEDAATAVLAEAIVRALPKENDQKPANGRRLLAFSDSRQRAAHFAPYLARTSAETQYMQPMLQAIEEALVNEPAGVSLEEISERFLKIAQKQPYIVIRKTDEEDGEVTSEIKPGSEIYREDKRVLKRECLISLLQEFSGPARARNSLPGLGLAFVAVDWTQGQMEKLPKLLPALFDSGEQQGHAVLQNLLTIFLRKKAITLPEGITLGHLMSEGPKGVSFHYTDAGAREGRTLIRWNAYRAKRKADVVGRSPQVEILARLLEADKHADEVLLSELLDQSWQAFRDLKVLESAFSGEYQLPWDRLLVRNDRPWFACERCGQMTVFPVRSSCVMPNCGGRLIRLAPEDLSRRWENHHGYHRHAKMAALPLQVKEHTAQLVNKTGRDYQRRFKDADINVLSSSTTFEMGVDVGQLKSVFLRNVPPTPANYIQRAGRAGRRREGAAYAVTYARSLPHDQAHFYKPLDIVLGSVPVPRIKLQNMRLTERHINSFLLGQYLRTGGVHFDSENILVCDFFIAASPDRSPAAGYSAWLSNHPELREPIAAIVTACDIAPEEFCRSSERAMSQVGRDLAEQLAAFKSQRDELEEVIRTSGGRVQMGAVYAKQSVEKLEKQLREERLLDFLSSAHWLPSYAFPQDVTKLLVRQWRFAERMRLERDAEYGIAEYAPGSEVVADGFLFTSRGIDLRNREKSVGWYRVCSECNRVEMGNARSEIPQQCRFCGSAAKGPRKNARSYVIPKGFTTRFDEPVKEVRLHRLKPPPNSEAFFIGGAPPEAFKPHSDLPGVTLGYQANGDLFRANSGFKFQQFRLCQKCGGMQEGVKTKHETPWGSQCQGTFLALDLACRFKTDTLQIRFDGLSDGPPPVANLAFWLSLKTAFISAAADALAIPARDIDGTHRSQSEGSSQGELIIYDRVPGGAGYVSRIGSELVEILRSTLARVEICSNPQCAPNGSCYACLRSYANQFQWDSLRRDSITSWLKQFSGT